MNDKKLLQNYVKNILLEYGDGHFDPLSGGQVFGSSSEIAKVFFAPIGNALGVIGGELAKLSPLAKMTARTIIGGLAGIIPGVSADWNKTFSKKNDEIKKIEQKYKHYSKGLELGNDAHAIAFLWNPGLYLVGRTAGEISKAVKNKKSSKNNELDEVIVKNKKFNIFEIEEKSKENETGTNQEDLKKDSEKYRKSLIEDLKNVLKNCETIVSVSDEKLAAIADASKLDKSKFEKLKKSDKSFENLSFEDAQKLLKNKQEAVKKSIIDTKNKQLEEHKKYLSNLKKMSEVIRSFNQKAGVSSERHGLADMLDRVAQKMEKILGASK